MKEAVTDPSTSAAQGGPGAEKEILGSKDETRSQESGAAPVSSTVRRSLPDLQDDRSTDASSPMDRAIDSCGDGKRRPVAGSNTGRQKSKSKKSVDIERQLRSTPNESSGNFTGQKGKLQSEKVPHVRKLSAMFARGIRALLVDTGSSPTVPSLLSCAPFCPCNLVALPSSMQSCHSPVVQRIEGIVIQRWHDS